MPYPDSIQLLGGDVTILRTTSRWGLTVNAYLLRSEGAVALIDTGFTSTGDALVAALDREGVAPGDIAAVFYTHTHGDHMGGGVALGDALGGDHVAWSGAQPVLDDYQGYFDALPRWADWIRASLPDGPVRDELAELFDRLDGPARQIAPTGPRWRTVEFGDVVAVGGLRLECVDARGHDPFHLAWWERSRGWFFTGDVLLPVPTPILPVLRDDLRTYRATLERLRTLPRPDWVFPGHGRPSERYDAVVERSRGHVRDLFEAVRSALAAGLVDPTVVADAGFSAQPTPSGVHKVFVEVGRWWSQLDELRGRGFVDQLPDRRWRRVAEMPTYDRYVAGRS